MKKIACCGYHITGSGVIDDLLREFDNVKQGAYEAESSFLKEPDMVSDLEYQLIENPQRMNLGYALKRYEKAIKERYVNFRHIFGKNWLTLSNDYLRTLITAEYVGYNGYDMLLLPWYMLWYRKLRRGVNLFLPKSRRDKWCYNYFPNVKTYHSNLTEEQFLSITRDYVENLCNSMSIGGYEYIMLDQLIPPTNPSRYIRYVNDLKVIIVDRDPRDVYIQHHLQKDHVLPYEPDLFCKLWKDNRKLVGEIPSNCLFLNFEDCIYSYDKSVARILDFLEIDSSHHINKRKFFNPDISIKNTRLWEIHSEYQKAIKIIETELKEYLYNL